MDSWESLKSRSASLSTPQGKSVRDPGGEGVSIVASPSSATNEVYVSTVLVSSGVGVDVCGGRVGVDNARFCTLECIPGTRSCRFVAHERKAVLRSPAYYIRTPKAGVAFVQPCVIEPPDGFPAIVTDSMTGTNTISGWNNLFGVLNCFDELSPSDQIDIISRANRKVTFGLTPMRVRKRLPSDDLEHEMMVIAESGSWSGTSKDKVGAALLDDDQVSESEVVRHVTTHWNVLVKEIQEQRESTSEIASSTRTLLEEVDDKIVKAISAIGVPSSTAPAVTLWASIDAHNETLKDVAKLVEAAKTRTDMVENAMKVNDAKAKTFESNLFSVLGDLTSKMEERESAKQGDIPSAVIETIQEMGLQLQSVISEITVLKTTSSLANGDVTTEGVDLRYEVGQLRDELIMLKADHKRICSEMNTESISFGGVTFQDSRSYLEFVKNHIPGCHWGFCYDFISVFELYVDSSQTSDDSLKFNHLIGKVGYKDNQSARIDNSFRTMIPKVFGIEQDPKNPSKKMGTLVSMDIWDHPTSQSGVKEDIQNFMDTNKDAVIMQIEALFGIHTTASQFFIALVNHVVAFWNHFEAWITRFEKDLTNQTMGDDPKTNKDSVWKLICWMMHAMFKEFLKRRQPGSSMAVFSAGSSRTEDELQRKCATILHGTLAAHKFMKELMSDNFVRHPIFSATMDEYLLKTKASQVAVVSLQAQFGVLENKVKGFQASLDRLLNEKKQKGGGHAQPK